MLLSDRETAEFLQRELVPAWHEVRPVPKVTIDFGDGRVMRRTLAGNTVMYLCLPDGTVVDAYPGVYAPSDFRAVLDQGLEAARRAMALAPGLRAGFLAGWHRSMLDREVMEEQKRVSMAKAIVESPLLAAMGKGRGSLVETTASKAIAQAPLLSPGARPPQGDVGGDALDRYSASLVDMSKSAASPAEVRSRLGIPEGTPPEEAARRIVLMDSATNVRYVRPAVHMLLARGGTHTPASITPTLYKKLLHIDIADPYLGLKDLAPPGTPDR